MIGARSGTVTIQLAVAPYIRNSSIRSMAREQLTVVASYVNNHLTDNIGDLTALPSFITFVAASRNSILILLIEEPSRLLEHRLHMLDTALKIMLLVCACSSLAESLRSARP